MVTDPEFADDCLDIYHALLVKAGYDYNMVLEIFNKLKNKNPKNMRNRRYGKFWNFINENEHSNRMDYDSNFIFDKKLKE